MNQDTSDLKIILTNDVSMRLIWCPSGRFLMGNPSSDGGDRPHEVELTQGFWIGATLVTIELWQSLGFPLTNGLKALPDHPISETRWYDAMDFCSQLTEKLRSNELIEDTQAFNLPTEAQWEYACRAGTTSTWFFGEEVELLGDYGWSRENAQRSTHPVAALKPNPWGLYDLYGNVYEWCLDEANLYPRTKDLIKDPIGSIISGGKVMRGGDFITPARLCSSYYRLSCEANNRMFDPIGFRLVLNTLSI